MVAVSIIGACALSTASAQVSVLTQRYDNYRSSVNNAESILNPADVGPGTFGKLFSRTVDGQVYTQPLYVPKVKLADQSVHNLIIVGTENDSVYAFDADDPAASNPIWQTSFINPLSGVTPVPTAEVTNAPDLHPMFGITATPVISWNAATNSGTLYVTAKTKEIVNSQTQYVWRLHALNVVTGAEQTGSPVVISGSVPGPNNTPTVFSAMTQNQRTGLLLQNSTIYMAFGSQGDYGIYHGWVMAYNATTLKQTAIFCSTPTGSEGGIWQSGCGLSVDAAGNILCIVANGSFDGERNFGDSILKLTPALTISDYFTPFHQDFMDAWDLDMGSAGPIFLQSANVVFGGGKIPKSFLLRGSNFGKYVDDSTALESWLIGNGYLKSTPVLFSQNGKGLFISCAQNDFIRAYPYNAASPAPIGFTPTWQGNSSADGSGLFMTLTSNAGNTSTAVLWGTCNYSGQNQIAAAPGALQAYNPINGQLLWTSRTVASDNIPYWAKFVCPTVANGKVYVPSFPSEDEVTTPGQLICYGLLGKPGVAAAPAAPTAVTGNGLVQLMWTGVPQATSYKVYRQAGGAGPFLPIVAGLTSLSYTDSTVKNGTTYAYELDAVNSFGLSAISAPVVTSPGTSLILYRNHCGGPAVDGFTADSNFFGGSTVSTTASIKNGGSSEAVYQTARAGTFSYTISGLVPGATDSVFLAFAELQQTVSGQRIMNVSINGNTVISKLDLVSVVGPLTAYDATVTGQVAADGTLTISFAPDASSPVQAAIVSAIKVYGSSWLRPASPAMTAIPGLGGPLLNWSAVLSRAASYNIYRGTAKGAEALYLPGLTTTDETYFDYNSVAGTTYYYYVTANGPFGESAPSPEVSCQAYSFTVVPSSPSVTLSSGTPEPQILTISLGGAPGATGVGRIHVSNLPDGVSVATSSTTIQVGLPVTLTLTVTPGAPVSSSIITVMVASGPLYRESQFHLTVGA